MAANYLMEAGHKNIAYLMPDESEKLAPPKKRKASRL
jgi:DNA-binding LacI/PurR family transcriptional regulator